MEEYAAQNTGLADIAEHFDVYETRARRIKRLDRH